MTTNVCSLQLTRNRSKSISNVFWTDDDDDEKEDLLPSERPQKGSTLEKWMSNLNLKRNDGQEGPRRGRATSIFSRPPSHPRPSRRQSLAEVLRKPAGLKDDIKKMWMNRPSLNAVQKQIKKGLCKSMDALKGDDPDSVTGPCYPRNMPQALGDGDAPPTFNQMDTRYFQ